MNVSQIIGMRFSNPLSERKTQKNKVSNFGLTMASPLLKDTVSFKSGAKELQSRAFGVSLNTAKRVHEAAKPMQKKVNAFMEETFGDLLATDLNPKNIIYKLMNRVKSAASIESLIL